jgi:hypothetical protein
MADEAVSGEPVSEARFPANREKSREFYENRAVWQKAARQNAAISVSCRTIPYKMKQGINSRRTGNLSRRAGICSVSQGIAHHGIDSAAIQVKLRKLFSL